MQRLREEFDSDLIPEQCSTEYRTTTNQYEIPCSVCAKILFVNEETKRDFDRAIEQDLDFTLTCFDCDQDYDRIAYE
jgi:hypothetical protein